MSWCTNFFRITREFEEFMRAIKEINKIQSPKLITGITEMQITPVRHLGNGSYEILEPKTNSMRIKKKDLKEQNEYLLDEINRIKQTVDRSRGRIEALENPAKFKVGQVIGKYTVVRVLGYIYVDPLSMHKDNRYEVLCGDKIITISESRLSKKYNKLNK